MMLKKTLMIAPLILLLASCKTYHMSTQSLLEQMAVATKEKKINFIMAFPFFFPGSVTGNSLTELKVLDKNENNYVLLITHHTGIRITKKNNKKTTFYFDTLLIKDSLITGKKDHFFRHQHPTGQFKRHSEDRTSELRPVAQAFERAETVMRLSLWNRANC